MEAQVPEDAVAEWRAGAHATGGLRTEQGLVVRVDDVDQTARALSQDTERLKRMLGLIGKVARVIGSMHWTLLRFDRPVLAASDHPVALWPLERGGSAMPEAAVPGAGIRMTLELRMPLTARHALVAAWVDEPDGQAIVPGKAHMHPNLNAFTRAQAARQWYHHPDVRPKLARGRLTALSTELHPRYGPAAADASIRRARVDELLQPILGEDLTQSYRMVTVSGGATGGTR